MNEDIKTIINEIENELIENTCFHELHIANDNEIIFNYPNFWDNYSEFSDQITLETNNILARFDDLVSAGFVGFFWVNDYVKQNV